MTGRTHRLPSTVPVTVPHAQSPSARSGRARRTGLVPVTVLAVDGGARVEGRAGPRPASLRLAGKGRRCPDQDVPAGSAQSGRVLPKGRPGWLCLAAAWRAARGAWPRARCGRHGPRVSGRSEGATLPPTVSVAAWPPRPPRFQAGPPGRRCSSEPLGQTRPVRRHPRAWPGVLRATVRPGTRHRPRPAAHGSLWFWELQTWGLGRTLRTPEPSAAGRGPTPTLPGEGAAPRAGERAFRPREARASVTWARRGPCGRPPASRGPRGRPPASRKGPRPRTARGRAPSSAPCPAAGPAGAPGWRRCRSL